MEVISSALEKMEPHIRDTKTLIVVGTYTIGKERLFLAAAHQFNVYVHVKPPKYVKPRSRQLTQ